MFIKSQKIDDWHFVTSLLGPFSLVSQTIFLGKIAKDRLHIVVNKYCKVVKAQVKNKQQQQKTKGTCHLLQQPLQILIIYLPFILF